MSTYESYASKSSADCAAEFFDAQGKNAFWTYALILQTINPYVHIILEAVWPVMSYIHWNLGKMEASYHCAALGGEAGFSLDDGVWEKQLSYINQTLAEIEAFATTPYYNFYIIFTKGFALQAAFASLAL